MQFPSWKNPRAIDQVRSPAPFEALRVPSLNVAAAKTLRSIVACVASARRHFSRGRTLGRIGVFGTTGHSAPSPATAPSARCAGSQFAEGVPLARRDPSVLAGWEAPVGSANPD